MCPSKLEHLCIRSVVLLHRSLIDPDALKLISTAWLGVQCRFLLLLMIFTASNTIGAYKRADFAHDIPTTCMPPRSSCNSSQGACKLQHEEHLQISTWYVICSNTVLCR